MPESQQAEADEKPADEATTASRVRRRKKLLAGAAGLVAAAVAATMLTLVLPEEKTAPTPYTVAVTYKVTGDGKATITYNTGRTDAPGGREQLVELPWTKKVRVNPKSGLARVSLVLDEDGGKAQCAVAVRGHHRQRATAFGDFGRATCSTKVPAKGAAKR